MTSCFPSLTSTPPFRLEKQTSKNVADTTIKWLPLKQIKLIFLEGESPTLQIKMCASK